MDGEISATAVVSTGPTYSIGEAAAIAGVSTATVRVYERQKLLKLRRTPGGHRYFTEEDLNTLKRIRTLRQAERKLGLESIRQLLQTSGSHASRGASYPGPILRPGPRVRAFRQQRGLTLREVADSSGLSHSFLSSFERGLTGISANNLRRILAACGTNMIDLFSEPGQAQRKLVLPEDRPSLALDDGGVLIEDLAIGPRQLEIQLWTIQPGAQSDGAYSHQGEEAMYMLSGQLDVWLSETESYRLAPGACLYFSSSELHRWRNNSTEPVTLLWVNTPPTF